MTKKKQVQKKEIEEIYYPGGMSATIMRHAAAVIVTM
jgi:hypothetical protein